VPSMMAMLQFGVAGYKQARTIEGTLDAGLQKLIAKAKEAEANPPPDPEMQKAQAQAQADAQAQQMKTQAEAQKHQMQMQADAQQKQMDLQHAAQLEQQRIQAEGQLLQIKQQHEAQMKQMEIRMQQEFDKWDAELKAATSIDVALISAGKMMPGPAAAAEETLEEVLGHGMNGGSPTLQNIAPPPKPEGAPPP